MEKSHPYENVPITQANALEALDYFYKRMPGSHGFDLNTLKSDMKQMTTDKIFEQIIAKRAWYLELDIPEGTANSYASRFRAGKLSEEKKDEILIKAGYSVKQEKIWQKIS